MSETDLYGNPTPTPNPGTIPAPAPRPLSALPDDDDRFSLFVAKIEEHRAARTPRAVIEVHRLEEGKSKVYAGRCDLATFDLDWLQRVHGGGRYSVEIKIGGRYGGGVHVEVSAPSHPATPAPGGVQPSLQGPAQGGSPDAGFLVQFMTQQLAAQQAMTLELIKANAAKPADTFQGELVQTLLNNALAAKSGVGQIAQAMEIVDRIKGSGGGGGEDDGMGGLGKLASVVERVLDRRRAAAPAANQQRPAFQPAPAPAPAPSAAPAAASSNATNVAPAQAAAVPPAGFVSPILEDFEASSGVPIVRFCRALVASLELGTDTETAGILLYRITLASPALATIRGALAEIETDKAANQLCEGCPALAAHGAYVNEALDNFFALLEGDEAPEGSAA